jgi:HSP20 family protein
MNGNLSNLFAWDRGPGVTFRSIERMLDELFGEWPTLSGLRTGMGSFPAVNVGTTPDAVHVYVLAPGLDPTKLDVSIQAGALSIGGSRMRDESDDDKRRTYRNERFNGEFRRVIALPQDVQADRVDATYKNGVLHIVVPRQESAKPRLIEVK